MFLSELQRISFIVDTKDEFKTDPIPTSVELAVTSVGSTEIVTRTRSKAIES